MALSTELLSQFAKITKDQKRTKTETIVYGEVVAYNNKNYVRLDGSDLLTPYTSTVDATPGDRVMITLKNHTATITGNITSPAARTETVNVVVKDVTQVKELTANLATTTQLNAQAARIDSLVAADATINSTLSAQSADIDSLESNNVTISGRLTSVEGDVASLKAGSATVENLNAINATITDLQTNKLEASDIEGQFANIDFSNISEATMAQFYANSGLIKDVSIGNAIISGKLAGVTISGDLVEANTVKADKLVIKGEDGLYYALNTNGETVETQQTNSNSLNGQAIQAKSITATKIDVDDLVAFGATIGGFVITESSLYSGVKSSVDNTTSGIYMGNDGQVNFGDASNYVKYYQNEDGQYVLDISASNLTLSANGKSVEQELTDTAQATTDLSDTLNERITNAEAILDILSNSISTLIRDETGDSLMEQTADGWIFSMGELLGQLQQARGDLETLENDANARSSDIVALQNVVGSLEELNSYIRVSSEGDEPYIELGNAGSFKVKITNTSIQFIDGTTVPALITNETLKINTAEVENELAFGNFAFKARSNGNMGLIWKG